MLRRAPSTPPTSNCANCICELYLPKKWVARTRVLQDATVAVFGTNLFCWTKWPFYDPEVGTLNGASITRGFETASYPMTRTYGFNIKLSF